MIFLHVCSSSMCCNARCENHFTALRLSCTHYYQCVVTSDAPQPYFCSRLNVQLTEAVDLSSVNSSQSNYTWPSAESFHLWSLRVWTKEPRCLANAVRHWCIDPVQANGRSPRTLCTVSAALFTKLVKHSPTPRWKFHYFLEILQSVYFFVLLILILFFTACFYFLLIYFLAILKIYK